MAVTYGLALSSIKFKDVGAPSATGETSITGVQESFQITQADSTITDIIDEFSDQPLIRSIKSGLFEFTFDIAGIDYDVAATLTGGTLTSGVFALPTAQTIIKKKFQFVFKNGLGDIVVYAAQISSLFNGSDLKNNPLKLTIKGTALVDTTGFVDINTGTARTTW